MTSRPKFLLPLRYRILSRVLPIALVLLAVVSLVTVRKVDGELRGQIQEQVDYRTEVLIGQATARLNQAIDSSAAVAGNDIVINAIVDIEHRNSTLQSFIRSLQLPGAKAKNIVMADYRGHAIASQNQISSEFSDSRSQWQPHVMAGQRFLGLTDDYLTIALPVFYGGQPEAAIVTIFPAREFFQSLVQCDASNGVGFLLNNEILTTSPSGFVIENQSLAIPAGWFVGSGPVAAVSGLAVIHTQSDSVALKATFAVQNALMMAAMGSCLLLIAGLWFASTVATRPMKRLIQALEDVQSHTDLSRRVSLSKTREFAQLGAQFNSMLSELEGSTVTREEYRIPALVAKYTDNVVIVTDARGRIEWVNESFSRISGFDLEHVAGKTPGSVLQGPETDPHTVEIMRHSIANGRGFDVEVLNYHRDRTPYWVAIEARPIYDESENLIKFIAIESDISERRAAEEEKAKMSRKMMDLSRQAGMAEVATGVLHNVGNVLNSVNVAGTLLANRIRNSRSETLGKITSVLSQHKDDLAAFLSGERGKNLPRLLEEIDRSLESERAENIDDLQRLQKSVDHIKEIVNAQQTHARRGVSAKEPVNLQEIVEEAVRINQQGLTAAGITLTRDYDAVPEIHSERHSIIQILVNLVGNATHALSDGPGPDRKLSLRVCQEAGEWIRVDVVDNGIGIAAENLVKIFGHGFTTKKTGHGFGLHSCALAAESLGGSLTVHSDGCGLGATFSLRLPVHPASTNHSESSPSIALNER